MSNTNAASAPVSAPSVALQEPDKVTDLYFEDFALGRRFKHVRGRTVTEMDNVLLTHLTMNSAQAHFNHESMVDSPFGQRLVFGGITTSIVVGLASQDTAEHALAELSLDRLRLRAPVFHGDTLIAFTEVLSASEDPNDKSSGIVQFRHWGMNQRDEIVCEADRTTRIARRPLEI